MRKLILILYQFCISVLIIIYSEKLMRLYMCVRIPGILEVNSRLDKQQGNLSKSWTKACKNLDLMHMYTISYQSSAGIS